MPGASKSPIIVPADKVQTFINNLGTHEAQDKPLSAWKTYTLKKGDKLEKIADHYGIGTAYLKQLNGITSRTKVGPGFTLLVPGKDAPSNTQFAALDAKLPDPPKEAAAKTVCTKNKKGQKVCTTEKKTTTTAKAAPAKDKTAVTKGKSTAPQAKGSSKSAAKTAVPAKAPAKSAAKPAPKTSKQAPAKKQ